VLTLISLFAFYAYSERAINPEWKRRMALFPIFMIGSIGLSVLNSKAILEGLFNRKSAFIRTPKRGSTPTGEKPRYKARLDGVLMFEIGLILYILITSAVGISNFSQAKSNFIGMIFFNFWALGGLGIIVLLTIKHFFESRLEVKAGAK